MFKQFAVVGGALSNGRIFNGIRHPWRGQLSGPWTGQIVPEFPWESVAVSVANWLGVKWTTRDHLLIYNNLNVPTCFLSRSFQMKRCADTACLDWCVGASLMCLDCFAFVEGALRVGRIFNRFRHPCCRAIFGTLEGGRMVPEFPWERRRSCRKWMGVSSEQLATTFPCYNSFECTDLVAVVQLFQM